MTTQDQAKIDSARDCIREHLSHVGAAYATQREALDAARVIVSKSEQLDSVQIERAFAGFAATD